MVRLGSTVPLVVALLLPSPAAAQTWVAESFDGVGSFTLPPGWVSDSSYGWGWSTLWQEYLSHPVPVAGVPSYPNVVQLPSAALLGRSLRLARTAGLDLTAYAPCTRVVVSFWMYHDDEYPQSDDRVQVQVSTDGGLTWTDVGAPLSRHRAESAWLQHSVTSGGLGGQADVRVGFLGRAEHGNNVYLDDVTVASEPAPAVAVASVTVASDSCPTGRDNGNGVVEPGEEGTLDVTVTNLGWADATGVWATLSSVTPGVVVDPASATQGYGDLEACGGLASPAEPFRFSVDPGVPCGSTVTLNLTVGWTGGSSSGAIALPTAAGESERLVDEGFDAVAPPALPAGWRVVDVAGSAGDWQTSAGTTYPSGWPAASPPNLVWYNSWTYGETSRLERIAPVDLSQPGGGARASFMMLHDSANEWAQDRVQVQVSTDGATWSDVGAPVLRYQPQAGWRRHEVDLADLVGSPAVYVGVLGIAAEGGACHLDDLRVERGSDWCWCEPAPGLYLYPDSVGGAGCRGVTEVVPVELYNNTGSDGTFALSYSVTAGDAAVTGPASLAVASERRAAFAVEVTGDSCVPGGTVDFTVGAAGNGYADAAAGTFALDLTGDRWAALRPLAGGRALFSLVAVGEALYALGGSGSVGSRTLNERYDPGTGRWTTRSPLPAPGLDGPAGAALGGLIYLPGGDPPTGGSTATVYRYDPVGDSWSTVADAPRAVWLYGAAACDDGKLYRVGGYSHASGLYEAAGEVFDPATGQWTSLPPMAHARSGMAAVACVGGVLYVAGGFDQDGYRSDVEALDTATVTWSARAAMPAPRAASASFVHDGVVWAVGGYDGADWSTTVVYDPTADEWRAGEPLGTGRAWAAGAAGHLVGGEDSQWNALALHEEVVSCPSCPEADLAARVTDGRCSVLPGETETYTLTVSSAGPSAAAATVTDLFPDQLLGVAWTCVAAGGGTCGASGAGDLHDAVTLPPGATLVYTATGTVASGATGLLVNAVSVALAPGATDPTPGNDSGGDLSFLESALFCDDLETGTTAAWSQVAP